MRTHGMIITVHMLLPLKDRVTGFDLRNEGHAADYVSGMLTEGLERSEEAIIDWSYAKDPVSGKHLYARPFKTNTHYYTEGQFVSEANKMLPPEDPPSLLDAAREAEDWISNLYAHSGDDPPEALNLLREAIAAEETND